MPVRKSVYGQSQADVRAKMTAIVRDVDTGVPVQTDERLTIAAYLDQWLTDSVAIKVRPRTLELYSGIVRNHLKPLLGKYRLSKLTPLQVQGMLNSLSKSGLAPRTVRTVRSVLRQALQQALRWSLLTRNVATMVDIPRIASEPMQPYSVDEARTLLATASNHRLGALFLTATLTGLRRGEVLALRWVDVDLVAKTLTVSGSLQRVGGSLQRAEPKTTQSRRTLPLSGRVADSLRAHKVRQVEERLRSGGDWVDSGYVFTTTVGTPLEPRNVTRLFGQLVTAAGLRRQRLHDLRHCFATLELAEGIPARIVMEQLGHTQISTTLDIYSHVSQTLQRESVERLGALFAV